MRTLALCLAALGLAGCLEDLPDQWLIDDLRVLAVRAEPPEVPPGGTVALDALVVDPQGREITYAWYACIAPEISRGFFGGSGETSSSGGGGTALSDDPYGDSCVRRYEAGERWALKLGEGPTATLQVPADLFSTQDALKASYGLSEDLVIPSEIEQAFLGIAGVNYRVTLVVEYDGGRVETQKRVNVALNLGLPDNAPNTNPPAPVLHVAERDLKVEAPAQVEAPPDGRCFSAPPALRAGTTWSLTPTNIPTPAPNYLVLLAGGVGDSPFEVVANEEVMFYAFFTTRGSLSKRSLKSGAAPANEWRLRASDEGPVDLWVVARDGRGGTSWCHEPALVAP